MNDLSLIIKLPLAAAVICGTLLLSFVYLDMLTKGRFPLLAKAADLSCYTGVAAIIFLSFVAIAGLFI
jgi:hypothetical protein